MVSVAVVGATGFTGEQLVDILIDHPDVQIAYLSSRVEEPRHVTEVFPQFAGRLDAYLEPLDMDKISYRAEVVFLSLPHRVSFQFAPAFIAQGKKVIDISADYRLKDPAVYKQFYGVDHGDPDHLAEAVYGLPEWYRGDIRDASLIANPGCYPTAVNLTLAPLVFEGLAENIIVDAKSGTSGAGRNANLDAHLTGDLYAYKPFVHQHVPEMQSVLTNIAGRPVELLFTPHVIPAERGILATIYVDLARDVSREDVLALYRKAYGNETFVRVREDGLPHMKDVLRTNFCDIGFQVRGRKLIAVGCIDNLMKGAASQAVQNMNIMCGLKETAGLLKNNG